MIALVYKTYSSCLVGPSRKDRLLVGMVVCVCVSKVELRNYLKWVGVNGGGKEWSAQKKRVP